MLSSSAKRKKKIDMATVGSLFINLVAKVKPLEDGIKTARQKLRAFQARMSTSAGRAEFFSKKMKQARKSLNKFGKRMGLTVKAWPSLQRPALQLVLHL